VDGRRRGDEGPTRARWQHARRDGGAGSSAAARRWQCWELGNGGEMAAAGAPRRWHREMAIRGRGGAGGGRRPRRDVAAGVGRGASVRREERARWWRGGWRSAGRGGGTRWRG
jgi:hypothetical protein